MDPEIKELLEEVRALTKENHRLLKAVRRYQIAGTVWKILLWTSLIVVPLYFYQTFVAPSVPSSTELQKLLESYQAGQ